MKNHELIEILKKYPEDAEIFAGTIEDTNGCEVIISYSESISGGRVFDSFIEIISR